ncbi:hypothetical protein H5P28_02335 [Ruficoccus amylovorans]|uniref:Uncharacterized protein n=1 Tax=Ruficoccus amylovorans TaxID=1804625 RepID=A0A842H9V3_9BACT|nr:hypothetical protein [Ruficoccus amylovorans]MBC2593090.1 hypothetical protein [Ruficoccus amylovorans]
MNRLEKPFRLTKEFFIAWLVLALPTLWLVRPWDWELPLYSRLAGMVFLPFAVTIVFYCPALFILWALGDGPQGRRVLLTFLIVMVAAGVTTAVLAVNGTFDSFSQSWNLLVAEIVLLILYLRLTRFK